MKLEELNYKERALIDIIRAFSFLNEYNYFEKEISLMGRGNPSIIYYNDLLGQFVKIIGDESQSFTIVIQRKKFFDLKKDDSFFDISDYYDVFNTTLKKGRNYSLNEQSKFVKQYLLNVIKGENWIDFYTK